jgi:hypothetical protein
MKQQSKHHASKGDIIIASVWLVFFAAILVATVVTSNPSVMLVSIARP